jgi:chromosome segregation ATPase
MDTAQIIELSKWVIAIGIGAIVSTITGVILIIKAGKMMPKDLRSADLTNKEKEADVAAKMNDLADKAAEKAVNLQGKLDELEKKYDSLKVDYDSLKEKVVSQENLINKLQCEVNNYKLYTNALIGQIKENNLNPVEMSSLPIEDCTQPKKRKGHNGQQNNS